MPPDPQEYATSRTTPATNRSDAPFYASILTLGGLYTLLIVALVIALASYLLTSSRADVLSAWGTLKSEEFSYSIRLSLISCTLTAILSLWVAVPLGYVMSRYEFRGKSLLEAVLDIPVVLPPLVVGVALLVLFNTTIGRAIEDRIFLGRLTYDVPSVVLAQFTVAAAFAVRTMRVTFSQIPHRTEDVALTLGCGRGQAFWMVVLPEARHGILSAATLAWARALGEFGPILVFSGATRMRTEVLPTTVFLEMSIGNLAGAVAVSLVMVICAVLVLTLALTFGLRKPGAF